MGEEGKQALEAKSKATTTTSNPAYKLQIPFDGPKKVQIDWKWEEEKSELEDLSEKGKKFYPFLALTYVFAIYPLRAPLLE